jgi:hypothetical protein
MSKFACLVALLVSLAGCSRQSTAQGRDECSRLTAQAASLMAVEAKAGFLNRSTASERATYSDDSIKAVRLNEGGYAAQVQFAMHGGQSIEVLISADCYIGWAKVP